MKRQWVIGVALAAGIANAAQAQGIASPALELARIKQGVKSKRVSSYDVTGGNADHLGKIADSTRLELFNVKGAGIINHIWVTIAPPPPALSRHDIIVRMYWDGEAEPSVEAPIGDFFGQGWDESYPFAVLPLAAGPREGRAMVSYFAMPFAKGARIEIENDSGKTIDAFYYYVDYTELAALPADLGRFHAFYNHSLTEASPDGENEWSLLGPPAKNTTGDRNHLVADIEGKGHYVGMNYFVDNPSTMWYGEGDDMFFIDGESWPSSLHGTGTEDYFNTSWSPNALFQHPYFGYARVAKGTSWLGRTHVYRFHMTDPVYFDKSLRFSIEHGHDNNLTLDLSTVAYWYQTEPHKKFPALPGREARKPMPPITDADIHLWRHEWRKNRGNGSKLWGNERK